MGDSSDVTCDGGSSNASSHGYSGNAVSWSAGSTTPRTFSGLSSSPPSSCSSGDFEIGSSHSSIGRSCDVPDCRTGRREGRIEKHVHQLRNAVRQRFPVGIDREETRKLLDEHPVEIKRNIPVKAALKQRSARSRIDDRGPQSTQVAYGPFGKINGL